MKTALERERRAKKWPPLSRNKRRAHKEIRQLCQSIGTHFSLVKDFVGDDSGSPAMEYVLLAAAVAMIIFTAAGTVGGGLVGLFTGMSTTTNDSLANAGSGVLN